MMKLHEDLSELADLCEGGPAMKGRVRMVRALMKQATDDKGKWIEFESMGTKFRLKCKSHNSYTLQKTSGQRARWGNRTEIAKDVEHALHYGSLPVASGLSW